MNSSFFNSSKEIANNFLQSIVFIDDRAFEKEGTVNHEFDAKQITRVFANSRKVCAVYKPETLADIDNLAILAKKSDVTVLDWQINIEEEPGNGEDDAEEDDPRGPHTRRIIREILSDPLTGKGSLKLIVIYTGEIDLPGITDEIFNDINTLSIGGLTKGDCCVFTENIKIVVSAKSDGEDGNEPKFKHNPELNEKVVSYGQLPEFILNEFTKMTAGLLTNFVLQSLTAIRDNTFRLIKLYNKELDPSFMIHRLLLPNPEDSKEQLVEVLAHSIQALLNYNTASKAVSKQNILYWIDSKEFTESISFDGHEILIDNKFMKDWVKNSFLDACRIQWVNQGRCTMDNTPEKKFKSVEKSLYKKASKLFINEGASDIDCEFSILTHHKSNLKQPAIPPNLTLGSLIKQVSPIINKTSFDYFLCIQARCDSVRITIPRKFIFLRLEKVLEGSKFHFVIEDETGYVKLKLEKEAFKLRTIIFKPSNNGVVSARKYRDNYYFKSNHGERYKWIADLKDAHAQREANNFAAKISRVGLDESEWLRLWATSK